MTLPKTCLRLDAIGVGLLILMSGCGGDNASNNAPGTSGVGKTSGVSGTVVVDGSSTVFKISQAAQEAFEKVNPSIDVVVDSHGTGPGFGRYLKGETDIVDASRPAKAEEESKAKAQGLDWVRYVVGYDGIAIVVNSKNDFVKELSVAQLKELFRPGSPIKTWKDLNSGWPDRPIKIYTPDKESGTFDFFTEAIVGTAKQQRDDVQPSPDDNILAQGVGGDPNGIGYFGYAYATENADKLRIVPVKATDSAPAIAPTLETILKKTYAPLSRPLFIYVKKSAQARPDVAAFVKFYLENLGKITKDAGYVPPTPEDDKANRDALPGAVAASKEAVKE